MIQTKNKSQSLIKAILFSILIISTISANAQIYPATVSARLSPPYSVFLSDYIEEGSNNLSATVTFNDLNETDRDVYFKIRIESSDIAIYSKPDYKATSPFNLLSGTIYEFSGEDFEECLNYNNLLFSGINKSEFIQSGGRLPSNFYTIYLEIYDFKSGKKISNTAQMSAQIRLNAPPNIILPANESVVAISENQDITFQWQPTVIYGNGNQSETEYNLSLYQINDNCTDPEHAIVNKQANKIFESDYSSDVTFLYNINHAILQVGKKYAIRVHAKDIYDRDIIENNGYSEQKWFYYGYPENGHITIEYPENEKNFGTQDLPRFKWESPDNVLTNQSVFYEFLIVKTEGLTPEQAIVSNDPFYSKTTTPTTFSGGQVNIPFLLERQVLYAWQVKAFTGEQEIAKSDIYTCSGPPLLEMFWAGQHKVFVTKTTTTDYNHLSGEGDVKISRDGTMAHVSFNNIKVENTGQWMLRVGEISHPLTDADPILLTPSNTSINEECNLIPEQIKIARNASTNSYELTIKGIIEWDFPHAIDSEEIGKIKTTSSWFNYDHYTAYGVANLSNDNKFNLLEPLNHRMELSQSSTISLYDNKFSASIEGNILLPENIHGKQTGRVSIPFDETDNLFYISSNQVNINNNIHLIDNTEIEIELKDVIFDFSETQSPSRFSNNPAWKGVYFKNFNLIYKENVDATGQLNFSEQKTYNYNLNTNSDIKAWTNGEGLNFHIEENLQNDGSFFNTFPSELYKIKIDIENNTFNEGYVKGKMLIPIINETEKYNYIIPLTSEGFNVGYLEDDFTDFSYTLNPDGGDQQVNITIKTISFVNNERLEMTLDIGWPAIDVTMDAIDGFCIWGNYSIGFYSPNQGRNLVNNVDGVLEQYQITISSLGCGSSEGAYGFGASGVVNIGDDISGDNGAPKVNLYSVYPSTYAPFVDEGDFEFDSISIAETINNLTQEIDELNQYQEDLENLENSSDVVSGDVNTILNGSDLSTSDNAYSEDDFVYEENPEEEEDENPEFSIELLTNILEGFAVFLPEDQQVKLQETINFLNVIPLAELQKIYEELKDVKNLSKTLAKIFIQKQLDKINAKINQAFARLTGQISSKIDTVLGVANNFTDGIIDDVFDAITNRVTNLTSSPKFDVVPIVVSIVNISRNALKTQINDALRNSVNSNIKVPLISFIQHQVRDSVTGFISQEIGGVAYQLIDDGELELDVDFNQLLTGIGDSFVTAIDAEKLQNSVENLAKDFVAEITFDNFIQIVLEEVKTELLSSASTYLSAATGLLDNATIMQNITANVKFDFDNIGDKLRNGEIDQIIKLNLTKIKIVTKTIELEGFAEFKKDDEVWGNSFQLDVMAKIKLNPDTKFGGFVKFISGKTINLPENFSYWYVAAGVTDILVPLSPTPFNMTGIDGALYRRMSKQNDSYIPDIDLNFGIDVNMHLNDISTKGKAIKLIVGTQFMFFDDRFEIQINGDIKVGNKGDVFSLLTGDGFLNFNSATGHLIGQFNVMANTAPVICAEGELGVEIKGADDWSVYVGKRETPVFIKLVCKDDLALESWFDLNNNQVDLGLRATFNVEARTNWFTLCGVCTKEYSLFGSANFNFEASTVIWWDPFGINDALLSVSVGSEIGYDWRKNDNSGTVILCSVNLYGLLNFQTVPESWLIGELGGHITVLNYGIDFDAQVNHQFN